MRIICADPGLKQDSFGIVGIESTGGAIYPRFAREYRRVPFSVIAYEMAPLVAKIRPHFVGLELNNQGPEAVAAWQAAGIKCEGINTTGRLSAKHRIGWRSMDKAYTVQWVRQLQKRGRITWPSDPSPHMQTLEAQVMNFKERREYHGGFRYEAGRGHDDMVMAFVLCCHIARVGMEQASWN